MKIAWTRMKGACLLLLGLAMTVGSQGFAADITATSFVTLAESASATTADPPTASPFTDESTATPAKAIPFEPGVPQSCSPSRAGGIACDNDSFIGAPGPIWFRGEYLDWWTRGAHLPPM